MTLSSATIRRLKKDAASAAIEAFADTPSDLTGQLNTWEHRDLIIDLLSHISARCFLSGYQRGHDEAVASVHEEIDDLKATMGEERGNEKS